MEVQGKIFVVVAVLAIIMAGLYVYLFLIDRKVTQLEKEVKEKENQK